MPATNPQLLFAEANCYICFGPLSTAQALNLALLARALVRISPGAQTGPQALMTYAACFACYGASAYELMEMALLDQIAQGIAGSGGTSMQITVYISDPNAEGVVPGNLNLPALSYSKDNTGPLYSWDTTNHVWMT